MSGEAPDWTGALDRAIARLQALGDYAGRPAWDSILREELNAAHSQALAAVDQRAYARGIEEAAKVAASGKIYAHVTTGEPPTVRPIEHRDLIATAIRQLLEVKSEDSVEKTEKT